MFLKVRKMIVKKIFLFIILMLYFPVLACAGEYLNDDPNFPMNGGYRDYCEYTDFEFLYDC